MPRRTRKVVSREVVWVPESRKLPIEGDRLSLRVWTILGATDPNEKPEPFVPVHLENAFMEDRVHDWDLKGGVLSYYSRIWGGETWILVERLD